MVTGRGIIFICSTDKGAILGGNFTDEIGRYDRSEDFLRNVKKKHQAPYLNLKLDISHH